LIASGDRRPGHGDHGEEALSIHGDSNDLRRGESSVGSVA
jgi:hypothetical protein